jgi:hypothetical protein
MDGESLEARQLRLGKNQVLFRSVNEQVEKISEESNTAGPTGFICECAIPGCGSHVELALGEYEAIRRNPAHFFVLPDHVFPEVEIVVEDGAVTLSSRSSAQAHAWPQQSTCAAQTQIEGGRQLCANASTISPSRSAAVTFSSAGTAARL